MKFIPTSSTVVEKIKAKARELRAQHASLGQSRDAAARLAGYDDYHHVSECHKKTRPGNDKPHEQQSEGQQTVADVLYILPYLLDADPMYRGTLDESHHRCNLSFGIDFLEAHVQMIHKQAGRDFLRIAVHDHLRHLQQANFVVTADAAQLSRDLPVLTLVWEQLMTEAHGPLHRMLFNHAFLKVLGGYMVGLQTCHSQVQIDTSRGLISAMEALLACQGDTDMSVFLETHGLKLLPREMNIDMHSNTEDYEEPSSYLSRFTAAVSMEMAGLIGVLPIKRIQESSTAIEQISLAPTILPGDPVQRDVLRDAYQRRAHSITVPLRN